MKSIMYAMLHPIRKSIFLIILTIGVLASSPGRAASEIRSASSSPLDNPFVAVAVNPLSKVVTGYYSALRTAPGRTDECKFVFKGTLLPDGKVPLSLKDVATGTGSGTNEEGRGTAMLTATTGTVRIEMQVSSAPGDCDWVLESVGGPHVLTDGTRFILTTDVESGRDWLGIAVIRSKRAFFHRAADPGSVRKAFLVAGDLAYVLDEQPGWYRVRFANGRKEPTGWIKADDTIRF